MAQLGPAHKDDGVEHIIGQRADWTICQAGKLQEDSLFIHDYWAAAKILLHL